MSTYSFNATYTTGLLSAWVFDEGGGTTVHDRFGSLDCTISGATWSGGGVDVESNQTIISNSTQAHSTTFTFAIWVKRILTGHNNDPIGAQSSSGNGDWLFRFHGDDKLHVDVPNVASDVCVSTSTLTDTASEHVIVLVRTGGSGSWNYKIYLDGSQIGTTTANASNPDGIAHTVGLGCFQNNSWGMEGIVYQAALWNIDLGATNIGNLILETDLVSIVNAINQSDSFTLTDSVVVAAPIPLSFSDSMSQSDADTVALGLLISKSDSISQSDAIARAVGLFVSVGDSFSQTDSIGDKSGIPLSFGESLLLLDVFNLSWFQGLTLSDSMTLLDGITLQSGNRLSFADAITQSDALSVFLNNNLTINKGDSMTMTDNVTINLANMTSLLAYLRNYLNDVVN